MVIWQHFNKTMCKWIAKAMSHSTLCWLNSTTVPITMPFLLKRQFLDANQGVDVLWDYVHLYAYAMLVFICVVYIYKGVTFCVCAILPDKPFLCWFTKSWTTHWAFNEQRDNRANISDLLPVLLQQWSHKAGGKCM